MTLLPSFSYTPPANLKFSDGIEWRTDGSLKVSHYEVVMRRGVTREQLLAQRIRQFVPNYDNYKGLSTAQKQMFEATLTRMNNWHWVPVILLPPYSDDLLSVIKQHGWNARHRQVVQYLADLQTRYRMVVIDFSDVHSFGGWSTGLYDGIHGSSSLMRRMLRHAVAASGSALDPTVPYALPRSSRY